MKAVAGGVPCIPCAYSAVAETETEELHELKRLQLGLS